MLRMRVTHFVKFDRGPKKCLEIRFVMEIMQQKCDIVEPLKVITLTE